MPPEVPEEFAAAYRAAYERALADQTEGSPRRADHGADILPGIEGDPEGSGTDELEELPRRPGRLAVGTHRTESYEDDPTFFERLSESTWFVPALLAVLALLLILGAYAVGRAFSEKLGDDTGPGAQPSVVLSEGASAQETQPVTTQKPGKGTWDGKVEPVGGVKASVGCTSKPSKDASGHQVSYGAENLTDGVADTAWRCKGAATGEKITFTLPEKTAVGEVGLIPGYAKTDDKSGADRYAQNDRVTKVRWTIGKTSVEQKLDGSADDRSLRLMRVPRTETDKVELEILSVKKGPRNTTAISEVEIGRATR